MQKGVLSFEDLKEGMKVTGKVKNVVDFGAFVDIGIKESALIHVSEMSDRFVQDPMEVLKVGDVREFRIISLDPVRARIGLSLKSDRADAPRGEGPKKVVVARKPGAGEGADAKASTGKATTGKAGNPYSVNKRGEGPKKDAADDGMTYNPFAELLKGKKR
jgi:uncharacterized protein